MPTPAIPQAINALRAPVARPNADGRIKMPDPIIEPTTSAMSTPRESFRSDKLDERVMMLAENRFWVDAPESAEVVRR